MSRRSTFKDHRGEPIVYRWPQRARRLFALQLWLAIPFIVFGLAYPTWMVATRQRPIIPAWTISLGGLSIAWLGVLTTIAGDFGRVKRKRLGGRACAACDYPMAALAPEPDGCAICPECGAAWRLAEQAP